MGVEGATISAGGGGPSIGGGPTIGIGSTIVNEGPVAPVFLENTMPLTLNKFNPIGEIKFNAAPQLNEADVVAEAESVISQTQANPLSEEGAVLEAKYWLEHEIFATPDIVQAQRTQTALEAAGMIDLSNKVADHLQPEARAIYHQAVDVVIPVSQEKQIEQMVEEQEVVVDDKVDKNIDTLEEEEVEELKLKNVVDIPVSEQRVYEIGQATDKAEAEAKIEGVEGIEGWRIVKFLPHQHPGNESGIIRNTGLRDGSLDETEQELAAKKFASKAEVKQRATVLVSKEKPPVKLDKDGQSVEDQDVARVFKHNIFKPHPAKEVVLRIVKKRSVKVVKEAGQPAQVVSDVQSEQVTEGRIEDHPDLAELFQKAA